MVFSLTPRQSPSASLSLSPLLLPRPHSPSLPLAASLSLLSSFFFCVPGLKRERRAGAEERESVCVRSVCECEGCELIGLELEAASVARFSLPAPSHAHTHTYVHFQRAAGGGEGPGRLSKSQQPIRALDWPGDAR